MEEKGICLKRWSIHHGWKMRHKPTGLFFGLAKDVTIKTPSGSKIRVRTNLHTKGRMYRDIPTLAWIGSSFATHVWETRDYVMLAGVEEYNKYHPSKTKPLGLGKFEFSPARLTTHIRYRKYVDFKLNEWEIVEV